MYEYRLTNTNFEEYITSHPSLIIIGITYTVIFAILIYKCIRAKKKVYPYYEEIELSQTGPTVEGNDYQNLDILRNRRGLSRVSEALSTDEFEYFDNVSNNPLGQVLTPKCDPLYANVNK